VVGRRASDFGEWDVVENEGVAIGISSIAPAVSEIQSTSGFVSATSIKGSQRCLSMSAGKHGVDVEMLQSISGLSVRHVGNFADTKILKTSSLPARRELSNELLYAQNCQLFPEIVGVLPLVRIKL
jgi:hypothetical protein